ncbi:histidine phosphatase family protein [Brevibacterium sp.]|uniref:histidine phosphatase family protein n=1 Tax=Brevibacterium sp. TaxID=1701 RepID=UPI0028114F1F|nr:histidine phosphatase family protein [Brevibacterium sp.]
MPVIVLLRHGISSANTAGILAGHSPGVSLTEQGVSALEDTLRMLPQRSFTRLLHSPLLRCEQTARIAARMADFDSIEANPDIIELDYGDWTGRSLEELSTLDEWRLVLERASQVRFPAGESIAEAAARSVGLVHRVVDELRGEEKSRSESGEGAPLWAMLISHGDIIKAIVAAALGMPLDDFQRLSVAPGSFTVIDFGGPHPVMTAMSVTAAGIAVGGEPGGGGLQTPEDTPPG